MTVTSAKTSGNGRTRLFGAVTAVVLGGALAVVAAPAATAKPDPCAASSITKTVSSVSDKTSQYLEKNPETDRVMTRSLQQQAGPQSIMTLKNYFDANPKVGDDLREITAPLTALTTKCQLPISLPQILGLVQSAQNQQGALPGQLPNPAEVLGKTGRLPGPASAASH